MENDTDPTRRYQDQLATLRRSNQDHVLRWWPELSDDQQKTLLRQLESVPWPVLDRLIPTHVLATPQQGTPADIRPPVVHPKSPSPSEATVYDDARQTGRDLLRAGKVAAFTVAGGQGTRLGFDGPKGALAVTPVGDHSLFEIFAETIKEARRRYDAPIPWYIMTSPANHGQTLDFLKQHDFFALPETDVIFFSQGMLPALDFEGRLLLEEKGSLALAPDGHGGSLTALVRNGALEDMRSRGVEIISYFQIDNPLVKPFDPLFLGLHAQTGSEMSIKVTRKADDLERVGNVCVCDGKVTVIEYSDFPDEFAHARNPDGTRKFDAGNLAIHLLSVDFVDRVVGQSFQLPFRRANKKVAFVDRRGEAVAPDKPNAVKLETFIFDVLPLADNPMVLEVDRAEEFSPVKNLTGVDSLDSSRRDQIARACRWLEAAGVDVPRTQEGQPDVTLCIAPGFALDAEDIRARKANLPRLHPGASLYIE